MRDKLEEVKDIDFSVEEDENVGVNRVLYKHTPSQDAFTITRDDDGAYVCKRKYRKNVQDDRL